MTKFDQPGKTAETVFLCLPEDPARLALDRGYITPGSCPGGYELLLKSIAALPGDQVVVSDGGISVNQNPLPNTMRQRNDSANRKMKAIDDGVYVVGDGEVWVISGHDPLSYDSRYFGPIPLKNIQGHATPVLVGK